MIQCLIQTNVHFIRLIRGLKLYDFNIVHFHIAKQPQVIRNFMRT